MEKQIHIQAFFTTFLKQLEQWLPKLASGILMFLIFYIIALIVTFILKQGLKRSKKHQPILQLCLSVVRVGLLIIGGITALGTMDVNVSALVASLGLAGFALGFALKDFLSNMLAGVMILFYQPFKIGDIIAGAGFEGKVTEINLRYIILANENKKILIPNANVLTSVLSLSI